MPQRIPGGRSRRRTAAVKALAMIEARIAQLRRLETCVVLSGTARPAGKNLQGGLGLVSDLFMVPRIIRRRLEP